MTVTGTIQVEEISRRDPKTGQTILDRVSAQIQAGERIGLVGPSGSGKTSLLRAFAKLDPVDSGHLSIAGIPVERDDVPRHRRLVVYVAQLPAFVPGTVRKNLIVPCGLGDSESKIEWDTVESWLAELGKPSMLLDQSVESLSGGEQQIVSIVRALLIEPRVLLLDEPTAALDADSVGRYENLIGRWHRADPSRAFLWSSHDENQVNRMSSRRIEMSNGQIDRRSA